MERGCFAGKGFLCQVPSAIKEEAKTRAHSGTNKWALPGETVHEGVEAVLMGRPGYSCHDSQASREQSKQRAITRSRRSCARFCLEPFG